MRSKPAIGFRASSELAWNGAGLQRYFAYFCGGSGKIKAMLRQSWGNLGAIFNTILDAILRLSLSDLEIAVDLGNPRDLGF
jgi:hypothetical protein